MGYKLGKRSKKRLIGVHSDLKAVVERAIQLTSVDFTITEGLRSVARQRELVKKGASKTMNSRHLTGHAVDLAAYIDGTVRWDWPLHDRIAEAMKQAAEDIQVPLEWGGDWSTFKDGPHFQLPWKDYPVDQFDISHRTPAEPIERDESEMADRDIRSFGLVRGIIWLIKLIFRR